MGKGDGAFSNYPKHVFLILLNEFCERFSFYGMKAILVIFLSRGLNYDDNESTTIYHGFVMACYFTPIFGAMLADGLIGKYKTILYISMVYCLGNIVMSLSAVPFTTINEKNDQGTNDYTPWLTFIGLGLIGLGTGGIKPCVNSFGAEQFDETQVKQKDTFFSMFYLCINGGSLLSMIITPMLRSNVNCFDDNCYSLAFGVPAALMLFALLFFAIGTRWYNIVPPGNNVIGKMFGCIFFAIKGKIQGNGPKRDHWIDYADDRYESEFIDDLKKALRVMFMFLTFPIFWALYDQQGSRWILQATQLDGRIGSFTLEPDLIPVINPLLVLVMVPLCEIVVYPMLIKCKCLTTPLQKVGFGMFLTTLAFVIAGFLQIGIDGDQPPVVSSGSSSIKLINASPCQISVSTSTFNGTMAYSSSTDYHIINGDSEVLIGTTYSNCKDEADGFTHKEEFNVNLNDTNTYNIIFTKFEQEYQATSFVQTQTKRTEKGESALTVINALPYPIGVPHPFGLEIHEQSGTKEHDIIIKDLQPLASKAHLLKVSIFDVKLVDEKNKTTNIGSIESKPGQLEAVVIEGYQNTTTNTFQTWSTTHLLITKNGLSILWQLPQYFVMTLAEVFFIITGMNFAYSQAPMTMKAVLQATLLLTSTFGNLIVVIVAGTSLLSAMAEYFLFAGLMFVTMFIFAGMAHYYEYIEEMPEESNKDDAESSFDEKANYGTDDDAHPDSEWKPPPMDRAISRQLSRLRSRTGSSVYEYLGEGTKL